VLLIVILIFQYLFVFIPMFLLFFYFLFSFFYFFLLFLLFPFFLCLSFLFSFFFSFLFSVFPFFFLSFDFVLKVMQICVFCLQTFPSNLCFNDVSFISLHHKFLNFCYNFLVLNLYNFLSYVYGGIVNNKLNKFHRYC